MNKKKKKDKKPTWQRIITLVLGLGFAGSSLAIALSSVFSQSNNTAYNNENTAEAPSIDEQIQMQVKGYEKVLQREPQNITALQGLAQIHLQTGNPQKAIPSLEKLVEYYPEQKEYTGILNIIKQQELSQPAKPTEQLEPTQETE